MTSDEGSELSYGETLKFINCLMNIPSREWNKDLFHIEVLWEYDFKISYEPIHSYQRTAFPLVRKNLEREYYSLIRGSFEENFKMTIKRYGEGRILVKSILLNSGIKPVKERRD